MFTDIKLFEIDKQKFFEELRELNESGDSEIEKKNLEIKSKFKDKIRKYLPTCLNIINTNFNCKFSLYKVGNDYDANFKVIETNVKKDKSEVESELQNLKNSININSLSNSTREQIDLAIEILTTYVDDSGIPKIIDPYLQSAKPVASSIINNTPMMSTERVEQRNIEEQNSNIQYNPYADMPVNLNENQVPTPMGKFGVTFNNESNIPNSTPIQPNNMVQNNPVIQNQPNEGLVPNKMRTDSEYANSDVIDVSSLSIFSGNPNK